MTNLQMTKSAPFDGDDSDDFVMLDEPLNLAVRNRQPATELAPTMQIDSIKSANSFLVSICPPTRPAKSIPHVSCDIVLVIDVSGSMAAQAPLPDVEEESERESSQLTVLDLVRHACRTIVSTLNEDDRLALITFSQEAKVVQQLTSMTESAKAEVLDKVAGLKDEGATNLWAGIREGLGQFTAYPHVGNVQGLYVLTDGQPNYMCPPQGYVPKLNPILAKLVANNQSAPTIHSFGFGYNIRSDLLLSIAKAGNGNYSFISDVGMIGTNFVHAVANLYATYATDAVLEVSIPGSGTDDLQHRSGLTVEHSDSHRFVVKLGNIMFGQSRELVISHSPDRVLKKTTVNAKLTYQTHIRHDTCGSTVKTASVSATSNLGLISNTPQSVLNYHQHRHNICHFLASFYPIDDRRQQHKTIPLASVKDTSVAFRTLLDQIVSVPGYDTDPDVSSLLADLVGPQLDSNTPERGQIYQALQTDPQQKDKKVFKSYWERWGRHYLPSLWCAHMRQTCNSYKDPGPLRYGINSDIFKRCRDELDEAFDNLPAPVGTYVGYKAVPIMQSPSMYKRGMQIPTTTGAGQGVRSTWASSTASVSMARWNRRDNTCFLNSCLVKLADGTQIKVEDLRTGMKVYSPLLRLVREIAAITKTVGNEEQEICCVDNDLWITPWHPIFSTTTNQWVFPNDIAEKKRTLETHEAVYSIILTPSEDADSHAIEVGGVPCVTLGHGITTISAPSDVRAHPFFGNYRRVRQNMSGLSRDEHGRWLCGGVIRDPKTGLICGVLGASAFWDQVKVEGERLDGAQKLVSRL